MAFNQQELQIIQYGKESGKTSQEIQSAISKYRSSSKTNNTSLNRRQETVQDFKQFGSSAVNRFNQGADKIAEINAAQNRGEQGAIRSAFQKFGAGAGTASSVVGDLFNFVVKSGLTQEEEESLKQKVSDTAEAAINQPLISDAIRGGVSTYKKLQKENPALARDLESVFNIGILALDVAGVGVGSSATKQGVKTGQKVIGEGMKLAEDAKTPIGKALIKSGEKIEETVIKPQKVDIKHGFDIKNITKYDVGGSLPVALEKTQSKLQSYKNQLSSLIAESKDTPTVNLGNVIVDLEKKYSSMGLSNLGQKRESLNAIKGIQKELDSVLPDWKNKTVSLEEAIDAKRASGLHASFIHDPLKNGVSPTEKVWNDLYLELKKATENVMSPKFKEVNKAISELIPIEQALVRRMPTAAKNNVISLSDIISFSLSTIDPRAISIGALHRASKSGTIANALIQAGKSLMR